MELVPSALAVDPGRIASMQVHLTNTGSEPCHVGVEVPPDQRDWSWVHPESCTIAPGAAEVVAVFFKPARGPHPTAGAHTVDIVARSLGERTQGDAPAMAQRHGTVDVGPWVEAVGVLDPMVARDVNGHSFEFRLENRSNVPVRAMLSTEDPSGELVVDVRPAQVDAGPGATATAAVDVRDRKKLKRGEQRYRVCVLAKVEGGSDLRIEGAFYQQGLKPAK